MQTPTLNHAQDTSVTRHKRNYGSWVRLSGAFKVAASPSPEHAYQTTIHTPGEPLLEYGVRLGAQCLQQGSSSKDKVTSAEDADSN